MSLHSHASVACSASCLPYQATNASWGCSGIRGSTCFGNWALAVPKFGLPSPREDSRHLLQTVWAQPDFILFAARWVGTVSAATSILLMGLVPCQTLLYVQKSPAMKISMEVVSSGLLVTGEYFCSGWNGIFSLKHPLFSLKQSLHLDVDANEKPNQYFFMVNILFLVWENKAPVCTKPRFVFFFCSCSDFDLST